MRKKSNLHSKRKALARAAGAANANAKFPPSAAASFRTTTPPASPAQTAVRKSAETNEQSTVGQRCRICGLIFDAEPADIGRGLIDPSICIICDEVNGMQIQGELYRLSDEVCGKLWRDETGWHGALIVEGIIEPVNATGPFPTRWAAIQANRSAFLTNYVEIVPK